MTFKEKWIQEHPIEKFNIGRLMCPYQYGYEESGDEIVQGCNHIKMPCRQCWDREIPDEKGEENMIHASVPRKSNETTEEAVNRVQEAFADAMGVSTTSGPTIKDSGDRTQFETGAVRDMREGKGRCDLMPLEVASRMFSENPHVEDPILRDIKAFQNTRNSDYLYRALVEFCNKQYLGFVPTMLLEVAKHFEEGAKKYGENNWQKGIPVHCYIDSAVRHYLKWLRGDKDEPHERAFVWNLMCCIWEVDIHKTTVEAADG